MLGYVERAVNSEESGNGAWPMAASTQLGNRMVVEENSLALAYSLLATSIVLCRRWSENGTGAFDFSENSGAVVLGWRQHPGNPSRKS